MSFLSEFDRVPEKDRFFFLIRALRTKPIAVFAELRSKRPILKVNSRTLLVTLRRDVQDALNQNTVFTVAAYKPKMDPVLGPFMLARDNTIYNQRGKSIMRALMQQSDLPGVRRQVTDLAGEAIERGAEGDRLDITRHVTRTAPIGLIGRYFGFPGPDEMTMRRWSATTQKDMFYNADNSPKIHEKSVESGRQMKEYLNAYLPKQLEKVEDGTAVDTVVTRLLRTVMPREIGFDMNRILSYVMGTLIGGVETTSAAITQAMAELVHRPDALAGALDAAHKGDDERFDGYVWEALRFRPQAPFMGRLAESDYLLAAGTEHAFEVKAGTVVLLSHASAMLDETIAPEASEFRPDRPAWWYMHLGYGPHRCLGDQVSQQQVPEICKQILLAGFTRPVGEIDFEQGVFPESFTLAKD